MDVYGYCSDRMMVSDTDAFNPMPVYILLIFLDFFIGLALVMSLKYTLDKEVEHLNAALGMDYPEPDISNLATGFDQTEPSTQQVERGCTPVPWKWTFWPRRIHPTHSSEPSNA
jgi:hypothetical protein